MSEKYEDKTSDKIKDLVTKEFNNIDKIGIRDDQEILIAGNNICKKIIEDIKKDSTMIYGQWALEPITKLQSELITEHNNIKGMKLFTNNKDKISQVANRIDNAEDEALKRLAKNRTTQDSRNLVAKSNETYKEKPMFVMEGGNDVKKQTGNIIFTEASNPVKIHEALNGLFNNPNIVYEIDYSGCTNQKIKDKMTKLTGTQTCYLRYDEEQKTYTIRDNDGNGIVDRAFIWEGVKLIPAGVRQRNAYVEQKKENENIGKFDDSKLDELTNSMLKDMPSAKELEPEEQKALAEKTENRIIELLKKAKKLGYELDPECITSKWFGNGHMELHLNSGTSEVSRTIRGNDGDYNKVLGKKLDNFVDDNEGEYKTYLTKRVKSKWQELDKLTKTETSNISKKGGKDGQENLDPKEREKKEQEVEAHKQQVLYGIGLLEKMVDNYRETEGDSWLDNDDRDLVQIKQLIRNAKSSINESDILDDDAIIKNFVDPIRTKWASVKNMNKKYKPQRDHLMKVFFGTKEEQISAIRNLGGRNRIFDNTETSFLAEEIEGNDNLTIENADIQKCLDNINNRTSMSIYDTNGNINGKVKQRYDNTYESAKSGTNSLITLFVSRGWLPSNWDDEKDEVIKYMDKLRDQLVSIDTQVNNLSPSTESMIKENHEKRIRLEQKSKKTEEDMKMLQGLKYLEENPDKAKEIYKDIIETTNMELKYGNLGQVVRGGLLGALGKLGGGIKGDNADIYNDIKGLGGAFDFTDENAALTGEILTEITITVAVAVVTGCTGLVAVGGVLRLGAMGARGAKRAKLAKNIEKLIKLQNKYKSARTWRQTWNVIKETSNAGRIALGTSVGTGLLLEGTAFNAASNMVHSAMNGTSLDTLNLNPVAKENIQTAAFLGALSIGNKIGGSVITKLHGATKIQAFSQAGLKDIVKNYKGIWTESVISEATAMFGAEQGLNLLLGHDIIDPETGEVVTSHLPTLPTQQELIQMIGMILAFKVAKPGLWAKYEQKLNDGTLEICRSVKKNEVLIRDPKTGKVENVQNLIDGQYNNYKPTPEQYQLRNHNKWREKQSKYELEILEAQEKIGELPENLRSETMRKLLEAGDIVNLSPNDIKRIQREIGLKGKEVDGVLGPKSLKRLIEYISKNGGNREVLNDRVVDRATQKLHEKFDQEIMSPNGITIDGITYKLERRPNEGHNPNRKGRIIYTETGPDGKVRVKVEANSDTFSLPENSNGNNIRERYNAAREKYVERNLNSILESARNELDGELSRNIDSRSKDLEGRRKDRASLEGKKKNLSDEIDRLKSRKAKLEQQLQRISKELTIQPNISSLKDIYSIISEGNIISIGGKKMKFIGVKGNKIIFTEGKGKTREFSSFKELQDAKANFNFDIKNRQSERGLEQQIKFEELVGKEARTKNANEIIREYESLQRQKTQIEQDIRDGFFRENAIKLKGKHIWIDGIEYQCTDIKTNNGRTTLDFKKTDGSDSFTISSFEQLKSKGQVNGFGDRYDVRDKEIRAAGRELSKYERENHELLRGENGLFKGENKYVENKKQELQQIDQQLQNGRADYDNAKLATSPKKVPNPEYERIQKEIEGINAQLIERGQQLATIERDLGASDTEIAKLNQEIADLTTERDNLSKDGRGNNIINNNQEIEKGREEVKEEIERPEDVSNHLDKLLSQANSKSYENVKLGWVTQKIFETGVYIEGVHRRFKNLSLKPNIKLPKNFLRKMKNSLVEMKNKWGEKLSEYHKMLVEKRNKYLERKLSGDGNSIEIKEEEINQIEEQEQLRKQQEQLRKQQEQEQLRKQQEQLRKQQEQEQLRKQQEQLRKQQEQEQLRKQQEQLRKQQEQEQLRKQQEQLRRNGNEKPERGINTERREMAEVQRNSDVVAIGDLHGEYGALKGNMEYVGLAREGANGHLEWTGGNKKVVFQGDILGDRGTDGLRIIKEIHQLREQARQQGGDIDIIVGNHDDFMIAYLLGGKVSRFARPGEEASGLDIAMYRSQGQGLTELLDFIGINRTGEFDDFLNLGGKDKNKKILEAMKKSSEGRLILEEICNMKLVTQIDDVLYIHTNPTARMLQYLTRGNIQSNINSLNQKYQGYLKEKLLGEGNGNISIDEFNNISDIFLNTGNRNISGIENYVEQLKNSGINMISHGHSGGSPYRSTEIGGVKIVDTDYGYGKFGELDHEHSISIVKKENGSIESGEGYNKYIGKTIDFHLGDRKQYRGTIEGIQGVGKYKRVTIKYIDPQYGEQTVTVKSSHINEWGGFKIAA